MAQFAKLVLINGKENHMFKRTLVAAIVAAFALPALAEDAPQVKEKEQA